MPENAVASPIVEEEELEIPEQLPVLPLHHGVLFPELTVPLLVSRPEHIKLVDDALVKERVLDLLDHRWLDREVAEFESEVPTAENIARFVWRALKGEISPAILHRVRLIETDNNSVEYSEGGESG